MEKTVKQKGHAPVKYWLGEIEDAEKREKSYLEIGKETIGIYEAEKAERTPFNILYSNTETLQSAIFGSVPRPAVSQRYKKQDSISLLGTRIIQSLLVHLIDKNTQNSTPFSECAEQAVLEGLVPGRGVIWFKYVADIDRDSDGSPKKLKQETVDSEHVPWNQIKMGYAKTWGRVPWIAREHFFTASELKDNFGEKVGTKVKLNATTSNEGSGDSEHQSELADSEGADLAQVWEIWDKEEKSVIFVSSGYPDGYLKKVSDPLKLSGFFPTPAPLVFFRKISSMVPVPLYTLYKEQADELNIITVRLKYLIKALKIRGFYDSTLAGIDKVLQAEDNTMVPVENVAALQNGNLDKSIWMVPIEKIIPVVQQLFQQRQQIKTIIYELTGIADILRGSSVASETATAQGIKDKWGTLRIKKPQKAVGTYLRDCLRLIAEIAVSKFDPDTIEAMTGIILPSRQEQEIVKAQAMQAPPEQITPEIAEMLDLPAREDVYEYLRSDLLRGYIVDIETNSTVDVEATEDKRDTSEMMNAIAQFLNGVGPMVEKKVLPFDMMKELLLGVIRRFRLGADVEERFRSMKEPQAGGPDPKQLEKMQQELQKKEADLQKATEAAQMKVEEAAKQVEQERNEFDQFIAQEKANIKLMEKEASLNINFQRKELEQEKKLAIKEMQMEMKMLEKELKMEIEGAKEEAESKLKDAVRTIEDNAMNKADMEAKEKETNSTEEE